MKGTVKQIRLRMFSGLLTNFLAVLFFFVQSSELRVLYEWHFLSSLFRHFPTHRNIAYDAFLEFLKKYSKCNQRFGKWRRVSDFRECTVRSISDISFISSLMLLFTKVKSNDYVKNITIMVTIFIRLFGISSK